MEALATALEALDANRRVAREHANIDGVVQQQPERLEQVVCGLWRVGFRPDDVLDVIALEPRQWLVAMFATERLDDVPAHRSGAGFQPTKFRRAIVGNDERIDRARNGAASPDFARLCCDAFERGSVLPHEVFAPWGAAKIARDAIASKSNAPGAVAISVPRAMPRQAAFCPQHRPKPRPRDCCLAPPASLRRLPDRRPGMSCRPWRRSRAWRVSCRQRARS